MPLDNFAFVLFRPKSPGNIGAAARALKNMALRELRIVARAPHDGPGAAAMAAHGRDVLAAATVYPDLAAAVGDRTIVVGTTARAGSYRAEAQSIRETASQLARDAGAERIAIVFGPEDIGLTNQELKLCHRLVTIPTAPEYPSLNLAQSVMIVAYELMMAAGASRAIAGPTTLAGAPEVEAMLGRLEQALIAVDFLPDDHPDHIMFTLRALLGRAGIRPHELDVLNGIARQINWFGEGGHEAQVAKRRAGRKLR